MVIEVTADRLLLALENGVSAYPAMEGRFPCVVSDKRILEAFRFAAFVYDASYSPTHHRTAFDLHSTRANLRAHGWYQEASTSGKE